MKMHGFVIGALGVVSVSACVIAPGPGDREAATPPRLVVRDNVRVWDTPGNFGPVPATEAKRGATVCASLNTAEEKFVAKGYHAKAEGMDGKAFPGGGFFCVKQ